MKTALIDVDGVLAAFTPYTLTCVGGRVEPHEIVTWEIRDYLNEVEKAELKKLWHDADWWLTIPVIDDAQRGLAYLREVGYEIVALTAPFYTCKGWEDARRAWLKQHFDIAPGDIINAAGERKVRIHGDLIIDDKFSTIEVWSQRWVRDGMRDSGERAFLFDASYNQTNTDNGARYQRMMHWAEIQELVRRAA